MTTVFSVVSCRRPSVVRRAYHLSPFLCLDSLSRTCVTRSRMMKPKVTTDMC
ncbi:hypothetical protein HanIR_Chr09g0434291 [Helianthus annuus]|nr:hypothetical protein HanIR_Chr09g0434291 [Helianthus annuus]